MQSIICSRSYKTLFFAKEEFFHFLLVSLRFLLHTENNLLIVKLPSLTAKIKQRRKKFYRIDSDLFFCVNNQETFLYIEFCIKKD